MSQVAKSHMIYFEVDGKGYALEASRLAGVASNCPFVSYSGLPKGVCGITHWSGKIYPVLPVFGNETQSLKACTFLFSADGLKGQFNEIALAVPGQVRVFFAEITKDDNVVVDKDGCEATLLDLSDLEKLLGPHIVGGQIAA